MKKTIFYSIGIFVLIIAFFLDSITIRLVQLIHNDFLMQIMSIITVLGSSLAVTVLTTSLFLINKKTRKNLLILWVTLIIGYLVASLLKILIARERPDLFSVEETGFSFPSGHAIAVFAPFILIKENFPRVKVYWLVLAFLVLFSRVYLGVHYLSDIIGGAFIGYILGDLILIASKKLEFYKF